MRKVGTPAKLLFLLSLHDKGDKLETEIKTETVCVASPNKFMAVKSKSSLPSPLTQHPLLVGITVYTFKGQNQLARGIQSLVVSILSLELYASLSIVWHCKLRSRVLRCALQ